MIDFFKEATDHTHYVSVDEKNGLIEIRGRSILQETEKFWGPVLDYLESYLKIENPFTRVSISLEYVNISSSKRILFLLHKLKELQDKGKKVLVEWRYNEYDKDMLEAGQDYAYMTKIPFVFKADTELDFAMA